MCVRRRSPKKSSGKEVPFLCAKNQTLAKILIIKGEWLYREMDSGKATGMLTGCGSASLTSWESNAKMKSPTAILCALLVCSAMAAGQAHDDHSSAQPDSKHEEMNKRGDEGMGFDQDKITHHFLLRKDGGAIQVTADSADDKTSKEEIQMHLHHIARAFKSGDFDIPMFVHDQTPPGVATMKKLKNQIKYKYVAADNGGRVAISSANAEAVTAIHEFLKFQITEHQTGDALEVK
jgi:hypothetical protein